MNIGYYPNHISREATLRDGPGEQFRILQRLDAGQRVGRQSVRNPDRSRTPPRRDSRNRYAWVYVLQGGRGGWVRTDVLVPDPGGWADGPASADFEVGSAPGVRHAPRRRPRPRFTLGPPRERPARRRRRDVYLRYAARSTAFSYLDRGDVVALPGGPPLRLRRGRRVRALARGARGWVASAALRAP